MTQEKEAPWFDANWLETYTGAHFDVFNPSVYDIAIEDIAHSLARICRFGGHIKTEHYSVAEHSTHMARYATNRYGVLGVSKEVAFQALLHDAGEAYYGDIIRPIKHKPEVAAVLEPVFARVDEAIAQAFTLTAELHHIVRTLDNRILRDEKAALMASGEGEHGLYEPLNVNIRSLGPQEAEEWFLQTYEELKP